MQATMTPTPKQRKPSAKAWLLVEAPTLERSGTLIIGAGREATAYELDYIRDAAWGLAFSLRKADGTDYAVNLGDEAKGLHPQCECPGHLRWSVECKHLQALRDLVGRNLL